MPQFNFPTTVPPLTVGKADVSAISLDSVTTPDCSDTHSSISAVRFEVDMQDSSVEEAHHDVS